MRVCFFSMNFPRIRGFDDRPPSPSHRGFLTSATASSVASLFPGSRSLAVGPTVPQQPTHLAARSRKTPTAKGSGWAAAAAGGGLLAAVAADS